MQRKRRQSGRRFCCSIRLRVASLADGVSWSYTYVSCFTGGCRIICTSQVVGSSGGSSLALAVYSGDDMMSRTSVQA